MINFMLCVCYHNSKNNTKKEPSVQMYFSQRPAAGSRKIQKDGLCRFTEPRPARGAVSERRIRTPAFRSIRPPPATPACNPGRTRSLSLARHTRRRALSRARPSQAQSRTRAPCASAGTPHQKPAGRLRPRGIGHHAAQGRCGR